MMKKNNLQNLTVTAVAVLIAAMATAAEAGPKREREERHVVSAAGKDAVVVINPRGKTVIVGRRDVTDVVVVATRIAKARDDAKAEELLARLHYEVREEGDRVVVQTVSDGLESARSLWSVLRGNSEMAFVDYAIEVPRGFRVEAMSTSGDVRTTNVDGPVAINATSGQVSVRDVKGPVTVVLTSGALDLSEVGGDVEATVTSGDVGLTGIGGQLSVSATSGDAHVERVSGSATIQLVSGDLHLRGCLGDVTFQTSSGDAEILDVDGSISAITSSGDIEVMILPVGEKQFMLSSSSGDIGVGYRPVNDYGFLLDVSTDSGSIEGDMAIHVDKINRRTLMGRVGSGSSRVTIETASGNVTIREKANGTGKRTRGDE